MHGVHIVGIAWMSKQRTCKLVTKILMKTCSSLVKMISDGENNFMQDKCNKRMKYIYRKVLSKHKNANMGSSTRLIIKRIFILSKTHKYRTSFS